VEIQPYHFAQAHDTTYRDMLPSGYIHSNILVHLNAEYGVGYKGKLEWFAALFLICKFSVLNLRVEIGYTC
jgi:hypothetical protein